MIERRLEEPDGIIQVTSIGAATRAEIDAHYDALRQMIADLRAAGRPIRVLSDQTRAVRLTHDLNHHIRTQMEATYQHGDRVALLLATVDDKMYVREVLGLIAFAAFSSRIPAEMWLLEDDLPPPGQ